MSHLSLIAATIGIAVAVILPVARAGKHGASCEVTLKNLEVPVEPLPERVDVGGSITVTCQEGYTFGGNVTTLTFVCEASGNWSGDETCKKVGGGGSPGGRDGGDGDGGPQDSTADMGPLSILLPIGLVSSTMGGAAAASMLTGGGGLPASTMLWDQQAEGETAGDGPTDN